VLVHERLAELLALELASHRLNHRHDVSPFTSL
jgi:hypothetical protein